MAALQTPPRVSELPGQPLTLQMKPRTRTGRVTLGVPKPGNIRQARACRTGPGLTDEGYVQKLMAKKDKDLRGQGTPHLCNLSLQVWVWGWPANI